MTDHDEPTSRFEAAGGEPERFADDARRYRLDSRIATGGMGEVWRATDTVLSRTVAVKVLKPEYADDPAFRGRFATEARNAAALHHPNVAGIFDFGESAPTDRSPSPRPYLVMELVEGQPLSSLLRPDQAMDAEMAVGIIAQAADAIGAAHRAGIVHRDVKPANLLVTRDRTVKITDFGIARAADGLALTQTGMVMGTPQYISPEQAQGQAAGPAADVYSLAVVAFECLTGRRPFVAETAVATALAHLREPVPELPASVPPALANVVRRGMAKEPSERYADGAAFAAALRNPSGQAPISAAAVAAVPAAETQVLTGVHDPSSSVPPPTSAVAATTVSDDEPAGGSRTALIWVTVLLAALLLGLLLYFLVLQPGDDDDDPVDPAPTTTSETSETTTEETTAPPPPEPTTPEPTSDEPTSEAPETVTLDGGRFVGRGLDDVTNELRGLGLEVSPQEVANDGGSPEGTVAGINPSGTVVVGDTITVNYYGAAPEPEPEPTETDTPPVDVPDPSLTDAP